MLSIPRFEAPSISITSTEFVCDISRQFEHSLHGVGEGPFSQLRTLARMRNRCFPHPARSGKKIGVSDTVQANRVLERPCRMRLADNLFKGARPPFSGND